MSSKTQIGFSHFPFSSTLGAVAKPDALLNCLVFIPALIVPFSPSIAFLIGLLLLVVFGGGFQRWHRIFVSVVVIFAGAVLFGWDVSPTYDYADYYKIYKELLVGDTKAFFEYGKGVEVALPTVFWVFGKVFGPLNFSHFVVLVIFTASILLYIWLEIYGLKQIAQRQKAICVALVLMCFDFLFAGVGERQIFSSIMILYAITAQRQESRFFFILLAILFHTTALIFLAIVWLLVRYPKLGIGLCIVICGSYVAFYEIVGVLYHQSRGVLLFDIVRGKLDWYMYGYGRNDGGNIGFRNLALSILLLICTWAYVDKSQAKWRYIIMGLGIIYLASAFVSGHLSLRVGVFFYSCAFGYFVFLALRKQPILLYGFALLYLVDLAENFSKDVKSYKMMSYNYDIIGPFFYYLY